MNSIKKRFEDQVRRARPHIQRATASMVTLAFFPSQGAKEFSKDDRLVDTDYVRAFAMYRGFEPPHRKQREATQRIYFSQHSLISDIPGVLTLGGPGLGTNGLSDLAAGPLAEPRQGRALPGSNIRLWEIALAMDRATQSVAEEWGTGNFPAGVRVMDRFTWPKVKIGFEEDAPLSLKLTDEAKALAVKWVREGRGNDKHLRAPRSGWAFDILHTDVVYDFTAPSETLHSPSMGLPAVSIAFSEHPGGVGDVWIWQVPLSGFVPSAWLREGANVAAGAKLGEFIRPLQVRDWDDLCRQAGEPSAQWLVRSLVANEDDWRKDGLHPDGTVRSVMYRWSEYLREESVPTYDRVGKCPTRPRAFDLTGLLGYDGDSAYPLIQVALGDPQDLLVSNSRVARFDLWDIPPVLQQFRLPRGNLLETASNSASQTASNSASQKEALLR